MLSENIKTLRKQRGYSQETLAAQLNVVRQTISKWEKGLSVPDAEMLARIADLFEVSVSDLLGQNAPTPEPSSGENEVAKQLAILNEQLAHRTRRNKKLLKYFLISVLVAVAAVVMLMFLSYSALHFYGETPASELSTTTLTCTLDGEEYLYEITYDGQYRIVEAGGDAWISNHVLTEQYDDANVLIAQIQDYFSLRGGTCELSGDIP